MVWGWGGGGRMCEQSLRDMWNTNKQTSIGIMGIPEVTEGANGVQRIFEEIMDENFPNLMKAMNLHAHKVQ